jgi:1,4-alpha-glucan branching enzyme
MPGDDWQKFANLRTLLGYQWLFPGKQLLFMGCEFGQSSEWNANKELDWWLLGAGPFHRGLQRFMEDLNKIYRAESALWESDYDMEGFYWLDCSDHENSVLSFVRQNRDHSSSILVVLNLTPVPRHHYRIGLPHPGYWRELLNSDSAVYGGGNLGNLGGVWAENEGAHHQPHSACFSLPPLSIVAFKPEQKGL